MIGAQITKENGEPMVNGTKLTQDPYNPPEEVKKLLAQALQDYQTAYMLQNYPLAEFDGVGLLDRARMDQQLFGAYVGAEWIPQHKRWRWRGRKNTARNKLMGILAHMVAGMLFPYVTAQNDRDEPDKMTATVMRILVEEHLRKANYEMQFLFMACSALVNPCAFVHIEYVVAIQKIKQKLASGKIKIMEAVDEFLSGLNMHILQVDELLISDLFSGTGNIQVLPYVIRVRRISWDQARSIYAGRYFDEKGKDLFDYVMPGMTKIVQSSNDNMTMYSVQWTEADSRFVQVLTYSYRPEDLEFDVVGGVFMGNQEDVYNSNSFKHRRMSQVKGEYATVPVYPYVAVGFEPNDPAGRFFYYKSGAFKEYWDDIGSNKMDALLMDGTTMDVFKPQFLSGVARSDSTVMAPGATVYMPPNASATMYNLGPNLAAAINALREREKNMSESTQDSIMQGQQTPDVTATATIHAEQNARIFLGIFGMMIARAVKEIGELTMDLVIQHTTVGELDATLPEALRMQYKTMLIKGKEHGRDITHRIEMTDENMGREMSNEELHTIEWALYEKNGGYETDQRVYKVDPYKFARTRFSMYVDADKIIMRGTGTDQQRQLLAFQLMMDPRVQPFVDQKAVVDDFVIEPFADGDPERYKAKENDLLNAMMMNPEMAQGAPSGGKVAAMQPAVPTNAFQ